MARKKTHAEFVAEVEALVGDEYEVLGEYVNSKTRIEMKHKECGHEYLVRPDGFLRGDRCPSCFGNNLKTTEQFKEEVFNLVKDEYEVLGEYVNSKTRIEMKHKECGHEYLVSPNNFSLGGRCPYCANRKTTEQFQEEVFNLVKDEYEVLGEYVNASTKIEMKHKECGHNYPVRPRVFLSGRRCPSCFGSYLKTTEQFKEEVFNLVKDEYEVLGEYVNSKTRIEMKHKECGRKYMVSPNSFLSGIRCSRCYGNELKTTEQFKIEVFNLVKDEYGVLGEYVNTNTKIEMKHKECGHKYLVSPNSFLRGRRCPQCSESKGETAVRLALDSLHCVYEREVRFSDCTSKRSLPFDFAVYGANTALIGLIEFDGDQHFEAMDHFGGSVQFAITKRNDAIKTKYCADNGIPLLRIPYTELDRVHEIVSQWLRELNNQYKAVA